MFQKGDIVWMKTSNYPLWPGNITRSRGIEGDGKFYYDAVFIADNSTIIIEQSNLSRFDTSRPEYTPSVSVLKKNKNLKRALVQGAKLAQRRMASQDSRANESKSKSKSFSVKPTPSPLPPKHSKPIVKKQIEDSRNSSKAKQTKDKPPNIVKVQKPKPKPQSAVPKPKQEIKQPVIEESESDESESQSDESDESEEESSSMEEESLVPLRAEIPKRIPKHHKRSESRESSKGNSDEKMKQKQREKHEHRDIFTIKSLSRATNTTSTHFENQDIEFFQFKLEAILCLLLDTSTTTASTTLQEQFQTVECLFDLDKINPTSFVNSKICSILSLFLQKLSSKFTKSQLFWIQSTLSLINNRIVSQLNDFSFYETRRLQLPELFRPNPQQPTAQIYQSLPRNIKKEYEQEIISCLKGQIREASEGEILTLTNEILSFLEEIVHNVLREQRWNSLKRLINSKEYSNFEECFRKVNELMVSLVPPVQL